MDSAPLLELLPELVEIVLFGVGSVGLTVIGVFIERFALLTALDGETLLGGWFAVMGCMALLFGYLLFTDKLRPKLVTLTDA
ncbi:hypothetical protein GCM10008995_19840 [Halobellus salinus]|uniref:DUF8151 domain-containing protein n=1 Tax=Halobellus salinus TaxID=931585 RepID=A0A830EPW1_9EURY|nr:hypothetical protein [Halobellus salinus]GGJ09935.1 hypothetical protein GCM10008995_19840 [Halobellus salinus]SMP24787.1 hypothetical protein SAMN06265347_11054 [Halobellus salinus]